MSGKAFQENVVILTEASGGIGRVEIVYIEM